jgi:hypothetical protein|tara:strand:+ start:5740 stop:6147 length:408 start_codon:yes stop_codon:yes gene_type:complete
MNPLLFIKPLMGLAGGLMSNPIAKIVTEKTVGAIQHKLQKDKIIKAKEIQAAKEIDIAKIGVQLEQVRQTQNSWKDEWITVVFTLIFVAHFVGPLQPFMDRGWQILANANDYYWIIILTIVGGAFGVTTLNKIRK